MGNKILYFGYGANSQREMMEAVTGNKSLVGKPAILEGFNLVIQRLDQVPDAVVGGAPAPVSPRKILDESWNDNFETYMIKPDSNAHVRGTIWELTPLERELIKDWELVYFGWYKNYEGKVITKDGQEISVETEGWREGQEVDRKVDGMNYSPFLNKLEDFVRVAEKARREYLERKGLNPLTERELSKV